jgi:2-polyprenyl-3-methyl-5-hydroxy-6-metoxy-1,4-benzoquinol methylase
MSAVFTYPGKELELFSKAANWKKYMTGLIAPHLQGRILEVGAGLGATTSWLNTAEDFEWILLEPDHEMAGLLKKKIQHGFPKNNCTVINGTIDNVTDLVFDTILYIDVLEHIKEDSIEIRKAIKLLNGGGKLIILSPAFQSLYSPFDEAIGHFRRYSKSSLQDVIAGNIKQESLQYLDAMGFFSSLINRMFLRQKYPAQNQIRFWDKFLVPISIVLDKILRYSFGKSILGVWKK